MKSFKIIYLALLALPLCFTSCKTTKVAQSDHTATTSAADVYKKKVTANAQTAQAVTAKAKVNIIFGDKNFTTGGSLKMKRDDVIQLSLTMLGFEVGRMEFTKDNVLVVDRINKQYVRVPYSKVSFLQSAGLDFNSLQALFWNELFTPNVGNGSFTLGQSGNHTLLSLTSAPKLDYSFLTVTASGLIDRTTISPKSAADPTSLIWKYGDFANLGSKKFPQTMNVAVKGLNKSYEVNFSLSSLSNSTDWETRTTISDKYKQKNVDDILRQMTSF